MEFSLVSWSPSSFSGADAKELLLQWNLDNSVEFCRYRYSGGDFGSENAYLEIVVEFLKYLASYNILDVSGTVETPSFSGIDELRTTALSMDYVEKLTTAGLVSELGNIRGCFEERYHEITVNDLLREMMVNSDSENASIFSGSEKSELLFHIFKLVVVGGTLCQPDDKIDRYIEFTKQFYKDIVTVFKNSTTGKPEIAGKAFSIRKLDGLSLFANSSTEASEENAFYVVVDPIRREITAVKKTMKPFW